MIIGVITVVLMVLSIGLGLYLKHRSNLSKRPKERIGGLGLTLHQDDLRYWSRLFDVLDASLEAAKEDLGKVDVSRIWIEVFDVEHSFGYMPDGRTISGYTERHFEWPWSDAVFRVYVKPLKRSDGIIVSAAGSALMHELAEHAFAGIVEGDIDTHDLAGEPRPGRERWHQLFLLCQAKLAEQTTRRVKKVLADRPEKM